MKNKAVLCIFLFVFAIPSSGICGDEEFSATIRRFEYRIPDLTVVGAPSWHKVKPKEDLLEIARRFGLGYNEVELLFPKTDKWTLPQGRMLSIPTFWVLPPTQHQQLLINIPELRLYFYDKSSGTVQTYPIGIGDEGWETPLGTFSIVEKRVNPTWYIPLSLQEKYGMASMPPGPENPLGEFMMKFSAGAYGIHGTAMPWGVGRLVSHGCIRCYPEHIRLLFPQVPIGTKLEIIYEPIKFGIKDGQVFVEVHPDVYRKLPDFEQYARDKLAQSPFRNYVDIKNYSVAVRLQNGVPTNVSRIGSEEISGKLVELMSQ